MHLKRILLISFIFLGGYTTAHSQLKKTILDLQEMITGSDSTDNLSDSIAIVEKEQLEQLALDLETSKQKELELQMELEQLRFETVSADSIKRVEQKQRIDSLRAITPGHPVVVEGDTLYNLYINRGGHSPAQRATMNAESILRLGKVFTLKPDSLYIEHSDIVSDIMYDDRVILSFTDQDALWGGATREEFVAKVHNVVVAKLKVLQDEFGFWQLVKRVFYFVLVVIGQFFLFRLTTWLYRRLKVRIRRLRNTKLRPISIHDYELFDTQSQVNILIMIANVFRYAIMLLQLLITIPLLFAIFPQTEDIAYKLLSYIWNPTKAVFTAIINYIPNLFYIFIIWYVVRWCVRLVKYLAKEVETEELVLKGFYADWALPTFYIVRFLLYAFMIAMIYPYLPGGESGVFQGVSVFVGLIVSLGSTTVIGNIMAGLVMTYMRPFKVGDRIQLDDTVGDVIEKTAFVTRIKTPKNEVITIPNSFMMSSHTVNYSASARKYGLILHTQVCINYDVPWRKVHQLLIDAALETDFTMKEPAPFVLETQLTTTHPIYQINLYTEQAEKQSAIMSQLYENIRDKFEAADIEIEIADQVVNTYGGSLADSEDDLAKKLEDKM